MNADSTAAAADNEPNPFGQATPPTLTHKETGGDVSKQPSFNVGKAGAAPAAVGKASGTGGINLAAVPIVNPQSAARRAAREQVLDPNKLSDNLRTLCKMGFVFEAARTALADSKADLGKKDVFFRVVREAGTLGGDGDNLTDAIRNLNEQLRNCLVKETGEASVWKSPIRAKVGSWLPNIPDPESGDICTGYVMDIHLIRSNTSYRLIRRYNQFYELMKEIKTQCGKDRLKSMKHAFPDDRFSTAIKGTDDKTRSERMTKLNMWLGELLDSADMVPTNAMTWQAISDFLEAGERQEQMTDLELSEGACVQSTQGAQPSRYDRYAKR